MATIAIAIQNLRRVVPIRGKVHGWSTCKVVPGRRPTMLQGLPIIRRRLRDSYWKRGSFGFLDRVLLQLLHHFLDPTIKLRVSAGDVIFGAVFDFDVRI